ncbi:hypothetical protein [Amycolatopsis sp. cmx-4-83]|uniref:hypothetical protein n=1 Tax=Amycolatopsis sp. cmx-4-83 TaxID=2790940 RepID=UPI00397E0E0C
MRRETPAAIPDALKTAMRINLDPDVSIDVLADILKRYAESGVDEATSPAR